MPFNPLIPLVVNGDPVDAGHANRAPQANARNIAYLHEWMKRAAHGASVIIPEVPLEPGLVLGSPVYLNTDIASPRFEAALAGTQTDVATGEITPLPSADAWGIVHTKHNNTLGDVLVFGLAQLDITAAVIGQLTAGWHYLSGVSPGRLTRQPQPVSVPICRADGLGSVFVNPRFMDWLDRHNHHQFRLVCEPAGDHTPPSAGERHVITNANANYSGWLPADHAVFEGRAPAAAAFGYNLSADTALRAAWPPVPLSGATLMLNRGEDPKLGAQEVMSGANGLVQFTRDGIWWLSDCYGDVPWPTRFTAEYSQSMSFSESQSAPECPRQLGMELILRFTSLLFSTEAAAVTSLVSTDDRLVIVCEGTTRRASTGPLAISLNLQLTAGANTSRAAFAFKSITDGKTFVSGPVLSGLYAASANVTLTSDVAAIPIDPNDPEGDTMRHGAVGIAVSVLPTLELGPSLIRLQGATEEVRDGALVLEYSEDVVSGLLAVFNVPDDLQITSPQFRLKLRILGRAVGTLPVLTVSYQKNTRPTAGLGTPAALTGSSASIAITTTGAIASADTVVEAVSSPLTVAAGDTLYVTIERAADAYPGAVALVKIAGALASS